MFSHLSSARVRVFMWLSLPRNFFLPRLKSERFFLIRFFETRQDKTRSRVEIPKKQRQWERTEKEEREKNGSVVRKEGGGQQNANN